MASPAHTEPLPLLRTKLYRPRLSGEVVHRSRLNAALDRYVDHTVTLVCAPPGFGKTTMLSDWLDGCPCPNAWLSLDNRDSDLAVFLSYFVGAVRTIFPSACAGVLALLQAPALAPLAALATQLANDLDSLAGDPALGGCRRFVLVMDDYHLVAEPAVHDLVADLLRHPPRTLHLVVSARHDPAFLNHALRARGDFSEIRVRDLRFTAEETVSFMQQALESPLDPPVIEKLLASTEGWSTGLRLTALAAKAGGAAPGANLPDHNSYTFEYLMAEVLQHLPLPTLDFLLKTSILDRLSGPLCDAIAPAPDPIWNGRAYLEWLASENIFTFSMDGTGNWYRYHHMFQKLLLQELEQRMGVEEVRELHGRAAAWFAQNGLTQEAIEHALAAGDEPMAVRLVEQYRHEAMNREQWRQLDQWLSVFPRRLVDGCPELLMLEAWALQNQWRFREIPAQLDRIDALMARETTDTVDQTRLAGEVDALRALAYYYLLDWDRSLECARRALAALPLECAAARGTAWVYLANGYLAGGDAQGAIETLREGLDEDRGRTNCFPTFIYVGLCQVLWMRGDLTNLMLTATQMLQQALKRNLVYAAAWAHYFRACALYQRDDLDAAAEAFSFAANQPYLAHAYPFSQSAAGLAMVHSARGEYDRARKIADSVTAYAFETNNLRVMADAEATRACVARRAGATAEAYRWAASFDPKRPLVPLTTFVVPLMVRARILVAEGSPASLADAGRDLVRLHELAARGHNTRYMTEVLALQAVIEDAVGNRLAALEIMGQAVAMSEAGGMIRVFTDLGPKVAGLLRRLAARAGANAYVQRLLAAFDDVPAEQPAQAFAEGGLPQPGFPQPGLPQPGFPQPGLPQPALGSAGAAQLPDAIMVEPLSHREIDVLLLLSERLTDKEIAQELVISPQTVKRHASNIYQKLAVGSRRDAVARAAELGLLPDSRPVRRRQPAAY